ncbi:hypothetical protein SVAN01_11827 [Stagonosporopsis vannaccii]|nr:hypothetical protein SVAN01_11827 [Stagonosporopsis vannaccii]
MASTNYSRIFSVHKAGQPAHAADVEGQQSELAARHRWKEHLDEVLDTHFELSKGIIGLFMWLPQEYQIEAANAAPSVCVASGWRRRDQAEHPLQAFCSTKARRVSNEFRGRGGQSGTDRAWVRGWIYFGTPGVKLIRNKID